MESWYMKKRLWVILFLLFALLAIAAFVFEPAEEEREFHGTFVRGSYGHLHQADEKGEFGRPA